MPEAEIAPICQAWSEVANDAADAPATCAIGAGLESVRAALALERSVQVAATAHPTSDVTASARAARRLMGRTLSRDRRSAAPTLEHGTVCCPGVIPIPEYAPPRSPLRRMLAASFGQARRTPRCPDAPRLDGRLAVVTGATGGIGLEIARGLARRGAKLILPCRNAAKGAAVRDRLGEAAVDLVPMDLEDLESVREGARSIEGLAAGRPVDLLVENAGIWPVRYARTRQGHEIAFGVNVLAHFALRRCLEESGLLARARVVILTGDIYILESTCTPDFTWRGRRGGMRAYCRSKLGNLWMAEELMRRFPQLTVYVAHPGVVATNLGGDAGALGNRLKRLVMIEPELGAQMPLVCCTQPGLVNGAYYHNAHGRMRLAEADPARDGPAAARLWETCETLAGG
jgi:NAD(P)-dependent dehydrogenase (short-subunit alcohol dehydrogenase family)